VALRSRLRRVEKAARGDVGSFELLDGSRYYFDPASWDLFMHWIECGKAGNARNWPEPPEVVRKLTEAKDVGRAIEMVRGGGWNALVYDEEALITERRLKPRPLVTRYDLKVGSHVPIDPYEYEDPEDLSEQALERAQKGGGRWRA
jgi:hypothetical protein